MITLIIYALQIISSLLFIYVIIGLIAAFFVPALRLNPIYVFLHIFATPFLAPFRRFMPAMGGWDFSPLLACLAISAIIAILQRL